MQKFGWTYFPFTGICSEPVISSRGKHEIDLNRKFKEIVWYTIDDFDKHFKLDTNQNQIKLLSPQDKQTILEHCRESLEYFGYLS